MFTRQNYKTVAEIIKDQKDFADAYGDKQFTIQRIFNIAIRLADYFAEDNPRFSREKFLVMCGLMSETE